MDIVIAVLLGLVQGFLEFLPVSSTGHLVLLEQLTGFEAEPLIFHSFLHAGSMLAVILALRKDVVRILIEYPRMLSGGAGSVVSAVSGREDHSEKNYQRIISTSYRRLALMILAATIPAALIGLLLSGAALFMSSSLLYTGMGFLLTAIILLVTSFIPENHLVPKDVPLYKSLLFGLMQGLSVLPGISRAAGTISCGIFTGFSRKMSVRISYLMAVPVFAGALIYSIAAGVSSGAFTPVLLAECLLGMAAAALSGSLAIRKCLSLVRGADLKNFAYYCCAAGLVTLVLSFVL